MHEIVVGNERLRLSERVGKGGEGEVYALHGRPGQAVKIYNAGLRAAREPKVRAMISGGLAARTDLIAYPNEVACDDHGNFLGFLMRLVSGYRPLHELYSPKSRQRHFPKADYRFVVRAALNVARAVGKTHQSGCVIGDLNHSGILVSRDATIALIDADSFQFKLGARTFPCVVGVPEFTPPELQGVRFDAAERTAAHDHFGLAVAVFHLLFMGRHPYAGRYDGPDISMSEAIVQNRFAYSLSRRSATRTSPPPGALTLDLFPTPVRDAFEAAFGSSPAARPSASDWVSVLAILEGSLNRCGKVKTHFYPNSARSCPWCDLAGKNGFDPFPDLSAAFPDVAANDEETERVITRIRTFRFTTTDDLLPPASTPKREGSDALRNAVKAVRNRVLAGIGLIIGACAGFYLATPAWFIWLGLISWGLMLLSKRKVNAATFEWAYKRADGHVQQELEAFVRRNGLAEAVNVQRNLDSTIWSYRSINDEFARELTRLKSTREPRQRTAYLDRFSIWGANIPGVGDSNKSMLISYGIETAADVNHEAVFRVPGFGPVKTRRMVDWRHDLEARFRYNRALDSQDIADERALRTRFANQKAQLEATLRDGLNTLKQIQRRIDALPGQARDDRALTRALQERAQAEQDLKLLGAAAPISKVSLKFLSSRP